MSQIDQSFVFLDWFSWNKGITLPVTYQVPTFANNYSTSARAWLYSTTVGDFNNDHLVDIVVSPTDSKSTPYFLLSNGKGEFTLLDHFIGDAERYFIRNGTTADLNRDGWLDFVGFESTHLMAGQRDLILLNDNGKGFRVVNSPISETQGHHGGAVGDLNGDGLLDIFGIRDFGSLNYKGVDIRAPLFQQSDGSFKLGTSTLPASLEMYATGASAIGDLNSDGLDDIVLALTRMPKDQGGEQLSYDLLTSTPILAIGYAKKDLPLSEWPFQMIGHHWADRAIYDELVSKYGPPNGAATAGANSVALLDINSDGKLDIVVGSYLSEGFLQRGGGFQVFVNVNDEYVDQTDLYFPDQRANRDITVGINFFYQLADLNGDGRKDFIVKGGVAPSWPQNSKFGSYGSIFISSNGVYLPADVSKMRVFDNSVVGAYGIYDLMAADVNGDGAPDLVSLRKEGDFDWGVPGAQDRKGYVIVTHLNRAIEKDVRTPLTMMGSPADDQVMSTASKPYLRGMAGDDQLFGLVNGLDTALFYGSRSDFLVSRDRDTWIIKDIFGNEGTDTIKSVERISFSGSAVGLDLDGNSGNAARLLATVFGKDAVKNPTYAGFAISLFDQGYGAELASQVALNAAFGLNPNSEELVKRLWKNLNGSDIDSKKLAESITLIDSGSMSAAKFVSNEANTDAAAVASNLTNLSMSGWEYIPMNTKAHGSYADLPDTLYQFFVVGFGAAPGVTYMDQMAEAYRYWLPQYKDGTVKQIVEAFTTKSQFTSVYPQALYRTEGGKYYAYAHDPSLSGNPLVRGAEVSKAVFDTQMASLAQGLVATIVKTSASEATKGAAAADIQAALGLGGDWTIGKVIYTVFGNLASKPLSDPTWGGTAKQFANQVAVAKYYTDTLSQSTDDVTTLRSVMAAVTNTTDVSSTDAIASLIGVALLNGPGG